MDFKQIQELIKAVNKSNIGELSIKDGDFEVSIKQQAVSETQFVAMQPQPMYQPQQPVAPAAAPAAIAATEQPSAPPAAPAAPAAAESSNTITIKSPMIGTFYRSAGPDKPAFVGVGDEVAVGKVVCIVEAMKLFNEIESEVSGRIVKVLVDDATPVEYDQALFLVEPA